MKNFTDLTRKNDTAIFLGCGPSINKLDETFLDGKDVWVNHTFILHKRIVPDFYHPELKEHRNGPMLRSLIDQKKE